MSLMIQGSPEWGSTANPPAIPGKYVNWPDAKLRPSPPPQPAAPQLSLAAPYVPKKTGPASLA